MHRAGRADHSPGRADDHDHAHLRAVRERLHRPPQVPGEAIQHLWVSTFSRNPAALFSAGLGVRSTIIVGAGDGATGNTLHVTKTHRWFDDYRPALFETLTYVDVKSTSGHASDGPESPTKALARPVRPTTAGSGLGQIVVRRGAGKIGFKTIALYWLSVFRDDPPAYELDLTPTPQTIVGSDFANDEDAKLALAISASKLRSSGGTASATTST